ncbi:MAG: SDR family NAD(P)-dependent oxidoreductase [Rhodoferax sp.]|nr:SDR family NAD(P)-dependent oxidoreductase [Rhodoferax sp.]MCB2030441.1 SDR family NAD(P)-dependent oxidoreductase [Rhodoferax sp.]
MKAVLITGANRGIGLGHARRYAQRGVAVFATARTPGAADELQQLAHALRAVSRCCPTTPRTRRRRRTSRRRWATHRSTCCWPMPVRQGSRARRWATSMSTACSN